MPQHWPAYLWAVCVAVSLTGCGGTIALQSRSLDRDVAIDGDEQEWAGVLAPVENEDVTLGILNDDEYLYISLIVNDLATTRQILTAGMTVWFDPSGGKEQVHGIRFPLGLPARGGPDAPVRQRGEPLDPEFADRAMAEFEIVGEAGQSIRFPRGSVPGIEIGATLQFGTLVYELKVPLSTNEVYSFAVGARPGTIVGFGLETTAPDPDAMRGPAGRPAGAGGPGGGGFGTAGRSGRGDGFGGGRPGRGPRLDEQFELWTTVALAVSAG